MTLIAVTIFTWQVVRFEYDDGGSRDLARWIKPVPIMDERSFWKRLLVSLRWDFKNKMLTGGADF